MNLKSMDLIAFVFLFVVCPTWLYVIMVICSILEIKVVVFPPEGTNKC